MTQNERVDFEYDLYPPPAPRRRGPAFFRERRERACRQVFVLRRRETSKSVPARSAKAYRASLLRCALSPRGVLPSARALLAPLVANAVDKEDRAPTETGPIPRR